MKPMTTRSIAATIAAAAVLLSLSTQPAIAQTNALRLLVSNGMKGTMEELQPQAEKAIGRSLSVEYSSTAGLKKKIAAGETFDATIITVEAIDELIKQGKLTAASRKDVGRSELGIGIRKGAPRADIRTVESLKKSLLAAKSITYPQDGASRGYLEKMFERLGIAAQVKPKIILAPGSGPAAESVATGKAEMVMTLFSEIVPNKGTEILGPLPGEYQSDIKFAAAASGGSKNADAAKALIAFVTGPKAAPVLKAKGIEPR
jgi:molybdate transport system substrate-binding protein